MFDSAAFSIHAPARGATLGLRGEVIPNNVSIHAPARGATIRIFARITAPMFRSTPPHGGRPKGFLCPGMNTCFDPRPRTGGDVTDEIKVVCPKVSIHAPARGATFAVKIDHMPKLFRSTPPHGGRRKGWLLTCSGQSFDPRPRTGGDLPKVVTYRSARVFRSTPPHGGRRSSANGRLLDLCFDPRPRTGGDDIKNDQLGGFFVSIHAPARGATSRHHFSGVRVLVSIHAPARGGDMRQRAEQDVPQVSIHAPARGATAARLGLDLLSRVSIHAPARGATILFGGEWHERAVSIHAPARGATFGLSALY